MQNMKPINYFRLFVFGIACLAIAGCASSSTSATQMNDSGGVLTPYYTATQTQIATATPVDQPTITPTALPTATPMIITLKAGDTLWTIAAKAGLTKEQILAANPDLNPYSLKVGMQVVVPAAGTAANVTPEAPTPTAVAVVVEEPKCTPSLTGGLYCFAVVHNDLGFTVQGVDAQFILSNSDTNEMQVQPAMLPLNHLQTGADLPLFAYFTPPVAANYSVQVQLFSALPDSSPDSTLVALTLNQPQTNISSDGYSASVEGIVSTQAKASKFWIAAVAYDTDGNVVAVRQYSKEVDLSADTSAKYKLYVYSIAGKITRVAVFGEAAAPASN
jgi:LysM repeat protein